MIKMVSSSRSAGVTYLLPLEISGIKQMNFLSFTYRFNDEGSRFLFNGVLKFVISFNDKISFLNPF
jgi:hypothetical protein